MLVGSTGIADSSSLRAAWARVTASMSIGEPDSVATARWKRLSAIPVLPTNIAHSNNQHDAVVRAILDGDDVRARAAMEEHCDATAALLRGLIG